MNLQDTLEIFLVTYNRKPFLANTLAQLLAENSPVRNCQITVLDNCSTDGTGELIDAYCQKMPNVRHLRHPKNIGGNANIARAFERAQKPYFWVLCDDDTYDFSHWDLVEKAMQRQDALIVVNRDWLTRYQLPETPANLLRLLTFCPAAIHRTDTLTTPALFNILYSISTWFPHLAAVCEVFNHHKPFTVLPYNIVCTGENDNNKKPDYHRHTPGIADPYKYTFLEINYLRALSLVADKKLRTQAVESFAGKKKSFFKSCCSLVKQNIIEQNHAMANYFDALNVMSAWQQMRFLLAFVVTYGHFILCYPHFLAKRKKFLQQIER